MKKLFSFFMAIFFSVGLLAACSGAHAAFTQANTLAQRQLEPGGLSFTELEAPLQGAFEDRSNEGKLKVAFDGVYTDKEHVAAYIKSFGRLPQNYITKGEAKKLGWQSRGTLDKVAPGKSIGGDRFGNYEKLLPDKVGRLWRECDIDYVRGGRGGKRLVYSNDGLIYYTGDHYRSFTRLY